MHPKHGYYCKSQLDGHHQSDERIFGKSGDFTTSPEISQIFGETLAVWFMNRLQNGSNASPARVRLVELGPGKGTLAADMLRVP